MQVKYVYDKVIDQEGKTVASCFHKIHIIDDFHTEKFPPECLTHDEYELDKEGNYVIPSHQFDTEIEARQDFYMNRDSFVKGLD